MTTESSASLTKIVGAMLALAVAFTLGFVVRSQLPEERETPDAVEVVAQDLLRQITEQRESAARVVRVDGLGVGREDLSMFEAGFEPAPPGATRPVKVDGVKPEYTDLAKAARLQGVVILRAAIDQEGNVAGVEVLKELPMGLTEAAVDAVKQSKFEPATIDGEPIPVSHHVSVNFRLGKLG